LCQPSSLYSPECVEYEFSEVGLPLYGVLRSLAIVQNQLLGSGLSQLPSSLRLTLACISEHFWAHGTTTKKIGQLQVEAKNPLPYRRALKEGRWRQ
jgi:hypothetical protein